MGINIDFVRDKFGKTKTLDEVLAPKDFLIMAALGLIPGVSSINKFGRNTDVDTGGTLGKDIWDGGIGAAADWVPPTVARVHQIVSSSVDDTSDGTGARTVEVLGLGGNFKPLRETVVMNGTTNVPTSPLIMIHRMITRTAGSTGWNVGIIKATADTDNTITAQITANFNQTQMAIMQIPAGMTGVVLQFYAHINKKGGANVFADILPFLKPPGEVWQLKATAGISFTGTSAIVHPISPPAISREKTLVKIMAQPSADSQDISAGFDIVLFDNSIWGITTNKLAKIGLA